MAISKKYRCRSYAETKKMKWHRKFCYSVSSGQQQWRWSLQVEQDIGLRTSCPTHPRTGNTSQSFLPIIPFLRMAACACMYVCMYAYVCAYMCVLYACIWLLVCVLWRLCGFATEVACMCAQRRRSTHTRRPSSRQSYAYANEQLANQRYFRHICI